MNDPYTNDPYASASPLALNLADFSATRFTGPPPEIKWLVQHSIPLGIVALLVSMGGVGKSYLILLLCLLVTSQRYENPETTDKQIHNLNTFMRPLLGGTVAEHGKAVFITAEDDEGTIHRRLTVLDPCERRTDDLIIIALPNIGGPRPFFVQDREGVRATPEWFELRKQLLKMTGLKLIAFDPLAAFCQVPLDADSAASQFVMSAFSQLAAETGATVLLAHHMRKANNGKVPETPADAREAIRGSSAIVDGVRCAYALWPADEKENARVHKALGILPIEANRVIKGSIVKSNHAKMGKVAIYVRSDDGVLYDRTDAVNRDRPPQIDLEKALIETVAAEADKGLPFTLTGQGGLYRQRERLPEPFHTMTRAKIEGLARELLDAKRIVQAAATGSNVAHWLDVPGGKFERGEGQFVKGASKPS